MSTAIQPELKQQHPTQPWSWREDWAKGEIKTNNFGAMIGGMVLAGAWNALTWTLTILMLPGELRDENYLALLVLIFPMAGIMLAVIAFRAARRYMKFGESTFLLAGDSGVIGGPLTGVVRVSVKLKPENGFRLTLNCVRRVVSGTGKNRRVSEKILWQSSQTMTRELSEDDPNETGVPVQFSIPYESLPSSENGASPEGVFWRLELAADAQGVDYDAKFEVPVFKTPESSTSYVADHSLVEDYLHVPEFEEVYREAGLVRTQSPRSLEIVFPKFRNLKHALVLSAVTVFWVGMTAIMAFALFESGDFTPIEIFGMLFVGVFSLFGLILIAISVELWLWHGRIKVTNRGIESQSGMIGFSRVRSFDRDDIVAVTFKRGMQAGQTIYQDLRIESSDGKQHVIGKRIANEASVRKIIEDINHHLGHTAPSEQRGNTTRDEAKPDQSTHYLDPPSAPDQMKVIS